MKKPVSRANQRGFALLIVFLMAAAIALMLYVQMPRVAFETERDKEQLLIDRGEQFKRAVQLFVLINKRYPARLEDLEKTNDKRFLRKRYIDPYTGKNEWRLVHTNGMYLTDSVVQKPPTADGKSDDKNNTTASGTTSTPGGAGADAPPDVNATVLQRPSDRTLPTGIPGQTGQFPTPGDPNQGFQQGQGQNAFPPITLGQLGPNGQPIQVQPGIMQNGMLLPGGGQPNGLPPNGIPVPGQPGTGSIAGQLQGSFQPGNLPPGFPGAPGVPGNPGVTGLQGVIQGTPPGGVIPGGSGAGAPNNAINLINNLLTTPRNPPPGVVTPNTNNAIGGGIAGVASTFTGPAIKSYNERTHYNEWEFVYTGQQQGAPGQANQPNANPLNPGQPTRQNNGTGSTAR